VQLQCSCIDRNADDWAVVSVSSPYDARAAAYSGNARLDVGIPRAGNFGVNNN